MIKFEVGISDAAPRAETVSSATDSLRCALNKAFEHIQGLAGIRLLPASARSCRTPKVFVVLESHDLMRDRRVVSIMSQYEDVDYDLVPIERAALIPDGAAGI